MGKLNSIERTVYNVIQLNPSLADDDMALIEMVWQLGGWSEHKTLKENLRVVPNPETITRARRRLHQLGKIQYSKTTKERRYQNFKKKTEEYSPQKGWKRWVTRLSSKS